MRTSVWANLTKNEKKTNNKLVVRELVGSEKVFFFKHWRRNNIRKLSGDFQVAIERDDDKKARPCYVF